MSQAEEHLPIDMRKPSGGIGSSARENKKSAQARDAVMGAKSNDSKEAEGGEDEGVPSLEACPRCESKLDDEWSFCARCGCGLLEDPAKLLGVTFDEDDLDQYLFDGVLKKTVKLIGRDLVLRTSRASDHKDINDYLMNEWADKQVTSEFWENLKGMATVGLAIVAFDGSPVGDTTKEIVDWMFARGSAFVDMITNRVVMYNRAVSSWLQKKNTFLAS